VTSDLDTFIRTLFGTIYLDLYYRVPHCKVVDYQSAVGDAAEAGLRKHKGCRV